jgi:hypothetical protein
LPAAPAIYEVPRTTNRRQPGQSPRRRHRLSGGTADGTKLQVHDCNGLEPQKWKIPV